MVNKLCIRCEQVNDRGGRTKLCSKCFAPKCTQCQEPNDRYPGKKICSTCHVKEQRRIAANTRKKCRHCGKVNDRGGRTSICSACHEVSPTKKLIVSRERNRISPVGQQWCSKCEQYLPASDFAAKSGNSCRSCYASIQREGNLRRQYNLTLAQYNAILEKQGGGCAICGNKPRTKNFAVDHDHTTGQVRGILCMYCNNKLLGGARDSVDLLKKAVDYLENPPAVPAVGIVYGLKGSRRKRNKKKTRRSK